MTKLITLIIPTSNRPEFIDVPIKIFLQNPSPEISVIVCDASDTPDMTKSVLAEHLDDPRVLYIDNTIAANGRPITMLENWNTAMDNVDSKWVSIIGDDDVLDPELLYLIKQIDEKKPNLQSIRWYSAKATVVSEWDGKPIINPVKIPMGTKNYLAKNDEHLQKILNWETFPNIPQKLSGLYHGAIKMDLMRRLKDERGAWFKYSNVDFEIGWLISRETELTFVSERPFSINGASPESNSWGVRLPEVAKKNLKRALAEGGTFDGWTDEFINSFLDAGGEKHFFMMLPVNVFGTTLKFIREIGGEISEETKVNFAKILIFRSNSMANKDSFDWYIKNTKIFLPLFFNKKVEFKAPTYGEIGSDENLKSGLINGELRFKRNSFPGNYEDLSRFILSLLPKVAN